MLAVSDRGSTLSASQKRPELISGTDSRFASQRVGRDIYAVRRSILTSSPRHNLGQVNCLATGAAFFPV